MVSTTTKFGVVAIGRNEGERLRQCLNSVSAANAVVYVDSGSIDESAEWARRRGAEVVELDMTLPFTAARARNVGFRRLQETASCGPYVQFVDGDCEVSRDWPELAVSFLNRNPDVAAVSGRLRERHPERSVYNWMCDREWNVPAGAARACGGIAMMRMKALDAVGGFRDDLIAGEEPELCFRMRTAGWRIWHLDADMAVHDAAMTHFGQWWKRAVRAGYAYAQGAFLHGTSPERHYVWESRRTWLWGFWFPLGCVASGVLLWPWGLAACLIYPLQVLRQTLRNRGTLRERATLASFQMLARFAESSGQIKFLRDRLLGRQARLIEYK